MFFFKDSGRVLVSAVCKIPSNLDNGEILAHKFDNEGIIEFTCNRGYKLIGPRVLRCDSGKWDNNIPSCRKGKWVFQFNTIKNTNLNLNLLRI